MAEYLQHGSAPGPVEVAPVNATLLPQTIVPPREMAGTGGYRPPFSPPPRNLSPFQSHGMPPPTPSPMAGKGGALPPTQSPMAGKGGLARGAPYGSYMPPQNFSPPPGTGGYRPPPPGMSRGMPPSGKGGGGKGGGRPMRSPMMPQRGGYGSPMGRGGWPGP